MNKISLLQFNKQIVKGAQRCPEEKQEKPDWVPAKPVPEFINQWILPPAKAQATGMRLQNT